MGLQAFLNNTGQPRNHESAFAHDQRESGD
jgi:hypothetical protein